MRCLPGLALLLGCLALPALAQRGGGHAGGGGFGGHSGGFGGHAGGFSGGVHGGFNSAPRGGFSGSSAGRTFASPGYRSLPSSARPGFYSGQHMRTGPSFRAPGYSSGVRTLGRPYGTSPRPAFYNRYGGTAAFRHGYPYGGRSGYGYGHFRGVYPRFFSPLFLSYGFYNPYFWGFDPFWDTGDWFDNDANAYGPQPDYGNQPYAGGSYANQPYAGQPVYPNQAPVPDAQVAPAPGPQSQAGPPPGPWAPQSFADAGDSVPLQESAVTILFKDGRQPVKVRNYALTRSSLLVSGPHARVIPVDEIDLAATERLNRAAGVDFRMP